MHEDFDIGIFGCVLVDGGIFSVLEHVIFAFL